MDTRQRVAAVLAAALATTVVVSGSTAAGAGARAPRVEDLAVAAVADLGDDAPAAVVHALGDDRSLRRIVREIDAGTLAVPEDPTLASTTTTTPAPAAEADGNPVVVISEEGIEPSRVDVDPTSPLIVANRGTEVHIVEIKGTGQQKFSLEPDLVGVYELESLAPGRYRLRCIVAGHDERATLTISSAAPAGIRSSFAAAPVSLDDRAVAGGFSPDLLATDDALARAVMFVDIVGEMHRGGSAALKEAERLREQAAREQAELGTKEADQTTADARRVVARAEDADVDAEMALLTNAILLAAKNGYDADQITEFILDDRLDPRVWETGQGPLRLRDVFLAGGVILDVVPRNPPVENVLREDPPAPEPERDEGDADGEVAGRYRGEFTGRMLELLLELSYPGGPPPIENRVDVTITDQGTMRFDVALVYKQAWITRDDTVTCDSRYLQFSGVTPRPTAELADDGTFESTPFDASARQTDFTGPECGNHVYDGSNDEEYTGLVIVGTLDGDTIRGHIPFEAEGERAQIDFRATRR